MKRVLIGGFLSLLGTIWGLSIVLATSMNLVGSWATPPGRFMTTLDQIGLTQFFVAAMLVLALGLIIMGVEYFKKD